MREVFRQERKFLLTYSEFKKCLNLFDGILKQDVHNVDRKWICN